MRIQPPLKTAPYKLAIVKFNSGRGALLCNRCHTIIDQDWLWFKDKCYYCKDCKNENN